MLLVEANATMHERAEFNRHGQLFSGLKTDHIKPLI